MLAALGALGLVQAAPAQADTTCSYDTNTRTVHVGGDPDLGTQLTLDFTVKVEHLHVLGASPVSCGGTTLTPQVVETIAVNHTSPDEEITLRIWDPETFEPGFSDEDAGIFVCPDEIEIEVDLGLGRDRVQLLDSDKTADTFRFGTEGFDWDPAAGPICSDADVLTPNAVDYHALTGGGGDVLSARGSSATGGVLQGEVVLEGQGGNDVLRGGTDQDRLVGGGGKDELFGMEGLDGLFAEDGKEDLKLNCGTGANLSEFAVRDGKDPRAKSC